VVSPPVHINRPAIGIAYRRVCTDDRLPCSGNNVDCSHFCFIVGLYNRILQRHCGCPHGMTINITDQRTCVVTAEQPYPDCPAGSFECQNGRCIAAEFRCDKENDCADGSDEQNCTGLLSITAIRPTAIKHKACNMEHRFTLQLANTSSPINYKLTVAIFNAVLYLLTYCCCLHILWSSMLYSYSIDIVNNNIHDVYELQ